MANEDVIGFNPAALQVSQIGDRWKVVEGTHWLLDFGPGEANARAALHFIKLHGFNQICFVRRPHPPMTYFKKSASIREAHAHFIDPRWLDFRTDSPRWADEQAALLADRAPSVEFAPRVVEHGVVPVGPDLIQFKSEAGHDNKHSEGLVTRHGISGALCGSVAEISLQFSASIIDIELAHFGCPPRLEAFDGDKRVASELRADRVPRQIERLRFVGDDLRRVVIHSEKAETILVSVRTVRSRFK